MNKKKLSGGAGVVAAAVLAAAAALGVFDSNAVDTAGSPLSVGQAQQLKTMGKTLFIQSSTWWPYCSGPASTPSTARQSLDNAEAGGLSQGGYFFVTPGITGSYAVDLAYNGIGAERWNRSRFQALDFEIPDVCWPNTKITIEQICDAMDALSAKGAPRVIYTSYHEWVDHLGNPQHCPDTWLWNASWDGNPTNPLPLPYGGWTADDVVLKQYHGDSSLAGVTVDLDSAPAVFPWEIPPPIGGVPPAAPVAAPYVTGITVHFSDGGSWELAVQKP